MSNISQNPFILITPSAATSSSSYVVNQNVQIISTPNEISNSNNAIVWTMISSAITSSSVYAQMVISVDVVSAEGQFFGFSGTSIYDFPQFQLTAKDEPQLLEYYSTGTTPTRTTSDVAQCIVSTLNEDFNFRERFFAVQSANTFYIQAKELGARYNMNFSSSNSDITLLSSISSPNDNIGQNYKDYAVWGDIYIGSSGNFNELISRTGSTKIGSIEIDYNKDNLYEFNVANFVEPYLTTNLPTIGSTTFVQDTNACGNVYLVFGNKYDEFENNFRRRFPVGQTEIGWTHHSGIELLSGNTLTNHVFKFTSVSGDGLTFLTNSPSNKEVYTNQKEFLSMIVEPDPDFGAVILGYYEYWNGTRVNYIEKFNTIMTNGGHYTVDVSYANIITGATQPVRRYTAALYKHNDSIPISTRLLISEIKSYEVQPDCPSDIQHPIIFLNTLGGWDSFLFNGETQIELERDYEKFTATLSFNPSQTDIIQQVFALESYPVYTAFSTWINKEHFDWLFEMTKSSDVRLLQDGIFKSIIITKFDYKLDTINQLYSVEVQYIYSEPENSINNF